MLDFIFKKKEQVSIVRGKFLINARHCYGISRVNNSYVEDGRGCRRMVCLLSMWNWVYYSQRGVYYFRNYFRKPKAEGPRACMDAVPFESPTTVQE